MLWRTESCLDGTEINSCGEMVSAAKMPRPCDAPICNFFEKLPWQSLGGGPSTKMKHPKITFQHFKWFLLLTHPLSWKVAIKHHPKSSSLGKFSQPHELVVAQNILDSTLIIIQQDSFSHWIASELSDSSPLAITKVNAKAMPRTTNMDQCQW